MTTDPLNDIDDIEPEPYEDIEDDEFVQDDENEDDSDADLEDEDELAAAHAQRDGALAALHLSQSGAQTHSDPPTMPELLGMLAAHVNRMRDEADVLNQINDLSGSI